MGSAGVAVVIPHAAADDEYIAANEALRRCPGLSKGVIYRAALIGEVRCILPPGQSPKYSVSDCRRLVETRRRRTRRA